LAIARELDDPALLARTLTACGFIADQGYDVELARKCFAQAIGLARASDDRWRLSQILTLQAMGAHTAGDLRAVRAAGEEGRDLADAIGDRLNSRQCRFCLGSAQMMSGDLAGAVTQFGELAAEADAGHDEISRVTSLVGQSMALAYRGEAAAARAAAEATLERGAKLSERYAVFGHTAVGFAALAAGDRAAAHEAREAINQQMTVVSGSTALFGRLWNAEAALADGDLPAARRWADEAASTTTGWWLMWALTARARVAISAGAPEQAERDANDALTCAADIQAYLLIPDILECLAALAGQDDSHREAARLFAVAESIRQLMGAVRFKTYDADCQASVAALRDTMGENDFDQAWAEGAALSTEEAITYAQRGRGQRKRPASGWASLTPTERDVVRLVSEGLANNAIATRLFVSPRTVQTHLTHVYTKLGLTSRVQLAQEAARHS
jgi:DNA-binding CsgD family transcriptional regulator